MVKEALHLKATFLYLYAKCCMVSVPKLLNFMMLVRKLSCSMLSSNEGIGVSQRHTIKDR